MFYKLEVCENNNGVEHSTTVLMRVVDGNDLTACCDRVAQEWHGDCEYVGLHPSLGHEFTNYSQTIFVKAGNPEAIAPEEFAALSEHGLDLHNFGMEEIKV